jgi:SAM-dependent methyltransferase
VLDIGCGTGGNLLAMALAFPESRCLGIDLSPRQIASARETARAIGVQNVRFESMSVTDVDQSLGDFDYIICHGVYSWVPETVQSRLLDVIAHRLLPNGIAYVSYNTYPGWHGRGLVREMMLFHDRPELGANERVQRARELLETVARSVPKSEEVYTATLRQEIATLATVDDSYLMHEELEPENHPVYFSDFVRRAAGTGLQFVAEAQMSMTDMQLSAEVRDTMRRWSSDEIQYEQYLDFVRNRTFRRSLLCHAGRAVAREPLAENVQTLFVRARCVAEAGPADVPDTEIFRSGGGVAVTMSHPVVRAALHALIDARPASLPFESLLSATRSRLVSCGAEASTEMLGDAMLQCALVKLVDLTTHHERCATRVTQRPIASPLARHESRAGSQVTSLTHAQVRLSDFDRYLLGRLDGTRGVDDLVNDVADASARGALELGGARSSGAIRAVAEDALEQFRVAGLLIG